VAAIRLQQKWLDGLAIGASSLCLVHCILLPALLVLLPALATIVALPEDFHFWGLVAAVPTSALAIAIGHRRHRAWTPVTLAVSGLAFLCVGELFFHGESVEPWFAVLGSIQLGGAHILNLHLTRHRA